MILSSLGTLLVANVVGFYHRKKNWSRIFILAQLLLMIGIIIALI